MLRMRKFLVTLFQSFMLTMQTSQIFPIIERAHGFLQNYQKDIFMNLNLIIYYQQNLETIQSQISLKRIGFIRSIKTLYVLGLIIFQYCTSIYLKTRQKISFNLILDAKMRKRWLHLAIMISMSCMLRRNGRLTLQLLNLTRGLL